MEEVKEVMRNKGRQSGGSNGEMRLNKGRKGEGEYGI